MRNFTSILISVFFILTTQISLGQITTTPLFPTVNTEITITFDSSKENRLGEFSGDLYAHTGVTIQGKGDWQNVIGDWGQNNIQPKLTNKGGGIYELVITPNIKEFYSVADGDVVTKMSFVFRSSDGSQQTNDLFVEVFEEGINVSFSSPSDDKVIEKNEILQIEIKAAGNNNLTLFFDGVEETTTTETEINTTIQTSISGNHELIAVAASDTEEARDTIRFFVREDAVSEQMPTGLTAGINYINDNTVTLLLYAPNKDFAFVIGDFTNWEIANNYQMKKDGSHFWITIDNLTATQEYVFQYIIDGDIRIADPYTDKILDPWNDQYIPESTYPDLIEYPTNKTTEIASVFQTAQTNFNWTDTGFTIPEKEKLIIYELLIRDFTQAGNIKTITDTLDYLQRLGVNAIELMPFNEFEGNDSWGYNPSFYFAPDKAYGTKNDYKEFINECHKRGIAVFMDMVLNHSYSQSPFLKMYFDGTKPTADNPWYNVENNFENTDAHWGYDFDHTSPDTEKLIDRINIYWMNEYHIDGFRFDFTKGFSNTVHSNSTDPWGSKYDQSRIDILKRMSTKIWNVKSDAVVIFEHLSENTEEKELAAHGILLWGNANHSYNEATIGYNESGKSDLRWTSWKNREWDGPKIVNYMESHDEERLMYKNLQYGKSSGDYDAAELNTALARVEAAASFFFTIPGPKMIWQFGELGYDFSIDENGRLGKKPVRWDYQENPNRKRLYQIYSALIKLKKEQQAFRSDDFTLVTSSALKRIEINHTDMDIRIIGNFDVESGSIDPNFSRTGIWYDYFSGEEINISDKNQTITLAPGEYHIYTTESLTKPDIINAPEAQNVTINGTLRVDETLTASYNYFDVNDDIEGASTYQWYRADNQEGLNKQLIASANELSYTLVNTDRGNYIYFEVTPKTETGEILVGQSVSSSYTNEIQSSTGINDLLGKQLRIYPNPFIDFLNLENLNQVKRLYISNIIGKQLFNIDVADENIILDISELNKGIYILTFEMTDGSFLSRKIIKK